MAKFRDFQIGTKVRFSGKFLRSTGQMVGGEGGKVFTVLGLSDNGWLTVDEPFGDLSYFTPAELEKDPSLKWRRIAACNVTIVGQLDSRECQ